MRVVTSLGRKDVCRQLRIPGKDVGEDVDWKKSLGEDVDDVLIVS